MKLITQEAPMGCGIACAASLVGVSYRDMRKLFLNGNIKDKTIGFYNSDFVEALSKKRITVTGCSAKNFGNRRIKPGTIVFSQRSKYYPVGHFLLKTPKSWMDPWKTGATISEAKAGWRKRFPGKKEWIIETSKMK